MALLEVVKTALRETGTDLDGEIQDLIDAAKADLNLSGVVTEKVNDETDPLIKRAVIVYCRANFDADNIEADRLARSYEMIKNHLTLAEDYNSHAVTINVTGAGLPVDGASITAGNITKVTNSQGVAIFMGLKSGNDFDYVLTAAGYQNYIGSVYVDGNKTVNVALIMV